jgi:hypothetical protein
MGLTNIQFFSSMLITTLQTTMAASLVKNQTLQSPSSSILCDELSPTDMNPTLILAHAPCAAGTDLRGSEQNRTIHPIPSEPKEEDVPCLPRPFDVLLGRGKSNLNHPGNKYFQGTTMALRFALARYSPSTCTSHSFVTGKPIAYSLTTWIFFVSR